MKWKGYHTHNQGISAAHSLLKKRPNEKIHALKFTTSGLCSGQCIYVDNLWLRMLNTCIRSVNIQLLCNRGFMYHLGRSYDLLVMLFIMWSWSDSFAQNLKNWNTGCVLCRAVVRQLHGAVWCFVGKTLEHTVGVLLMVFVVLRNMNMSRSQSAAPNCFKWIL